MLGLTQHHPLLLSATLVHAEENYPDTEIVSMGADGMTRLTYAQAGRRARKLASQLGELGLKPCDIAASIAWTTHRHFELFHALPGAGSVLQTVNSRHSLDQIQYAMRQTRARVVFVDPENIPLAEALQARMPELGPFVVMAAAKDLPDCRLNGVVCYEDLLEAGDAGYDWPVFDERTGSTLCFTSGTTGDPKGALYSHRGTLLSAMATTAGNAWALSHADTLMAISPLFHCNGWGVPYSCPMHGVKLVLPGRNMTSQALAELLDSEAVTVANGVPTVWTGILDHCAAEGRQLRALDRVITGGSAVGTSLVNRLASHGARTIPSWGMTETTHATTFAPPPGGAPQDPAWIGRIQGRPVFGSRVRIVDEAGHPLPRDGVTAGHLQARGHWMGRSYFNAPDKPLCSADGWMETGDIATLSADNIVRITDRDKDVIKSGGEWISSLQMEEAALLLEQIRTAAVVGVSDPRWSERPVLFVQLEPGATLAAEQIQSHLAVHMPKWWLPEAVYFLKTLPLSPVGKVLKVELRQLAERLKDTSPD